MAGGSLPLLPSLGRWPGASFSTTAFIVENQSLHVQSLGQLAHIWKSGYWPDNRGLELYRPLSETIWALLWAVGGGSHPALFHALGLALGAAVVLLLYRFLLAVQTPPRTAFLAAALFALFPIHTDATASVTGSAELLAAALALGALLLYYRDRPIPALILFASRGPLQGKRRRLRRASAGFPAQKRLPSPPLDRCRRRGRHRPGSGGAPRRLAQLANPSHRQSGGAGEYRPTHPHGPLGAVPVSV